MANRVRWEVDIDHWINGAAGFRVKYLALALPRLDKVMADAFAVADSQVHVITGFLKSTGEYSTQPTAEGMEGQILYGAEYAIYEFGRGGEHDPLTPAIASVEDQFFDAMMDPIVEVIGTWR